MAKSKPTRVSNVQVPGETPADTAAADATVTDADVGLATREPAAAPAARSYRDMAAADIDLATLTTAVLTRDGYLCPLPPDQK